MTTAPIDLSAIDTMGEGELAELQAHLEAERREHILSRLKYFARHMEIPGAPVKGDETSSFRSQIEANKRGIMKVEDDPGFPQYYYAEKLEPAPHHDLIMDICQDVIEEQMMTPSGEPYDGVLVFVPPGSGKSSYLSMLLPAYYEGRFKNINVIACSYGQDLANRFSRRARAIVDSPVFKEITKTHLLDGSTGVQNWSMANGSEYRAAGVLAGITGFRADVLLVDDPVKGREAADSDIIRDKTWEAFEDDLQTRLKPGGKTVVVQTRWHEDDLSGRLLGETWRGQSGLWKGTDGKNYYVINLPMICEHADDLMGRKIGPEVTPETMLWPEYFDIREQKLKQAKNDRTWTALYQQRPSAGSGNILLRDYWQKWPSDLPPECEYIFLSYDTALEEEEENDDSAMTAWGVFEAKVKDPWGADEFKHRNLIMLGAWNAKVPAVDLLDVIAHHREIFHPDLILVEKRASGHQLIQEMRRRRMPVKAFLPKGKPGAKGKVPRAHAASHTFESGVVYYMDGPIARGVIDQCASFPRGQADDLVDTVTAAIEYLRRSYLVDLVSDEPDGYERHEADVERVEKDWERRGRRLYG